MSERFLWQILSHHQYIHQDPLHLLKPPLFLPSMYELIAILSYWNDSMCGLLSQTH